MKAILAIGTFLLCALSVQEPTSPALSQRIDAAERLAAADREESAAAELARILELTSKLTDRKTRKQLEKRASKALKKCDKDHATARRTKASAAKRMITLASKYAKKDWYDSARELAALAEELAPGSADKLLAKLPPPPKPKSMDAAALLQAGPSHPAGKPWSLLSGDLRSDDLEPKAETWLGFAESPEQDWKLRCQVHPGSDGGQVGVLFGHRGKKTFYRLLIDTDGKNHGMQLQSQDAGKTQTLYSVRIGASGSELDDGIPLTMHMTGQTLRIKLGKLQPRVFDLPLESTIGKLGLWGANTGKRSFRAIFTKLEVWR